MILVLDNYDSFTFNLVQFIGELGAGPEVYRNDAISLDRIASLSPSGIIVSPGPGRPEDAGISVDLVRRFGGEIPMLGVCLGHQAVAVAYGGRVARAPLPVHGKTAVVRHDNSELFAGIRNPFEAGRYHSLVVQREDLPGALRVTASTDDGLVMAVRHREHSVYGVQFHPESILTDGGRILLKNFLELCGEVR